MVHQTATWLNIAYHELFGIVSNIAIHQFNTTIAEFTTSIHTWTVQSNLIVTEKLAITCFSYIVIFALFQYLICHK